MEETSSSQVVKFLLEKKHTSEEVRNKAIIHIIDGLAVMLAGSRTECTHKLVGFVQEETSTSSATLVGFNQRSSPSYAALVNATSGHADDYDDTQLASSPDRTYGLLTHPTVPVLASCMAIGEKTRCSGLEFIEAFIAGFEVECKIAEAINPIHYKRGFHTTGTIGTFGSFAASAKLMALNETELRYSLGIAASLASGIRVNFGTMTKPFHAGRAAYNGVTASLLGKAEFTSDLNALDGRWGFFQVFGDGYDQKKIIDKLGHPYSIIDPGATVKMYPCGSLGQPSMDTLLELITKHDLNIDDVNEIRVRAGPNILEPLRYSEPENELQAKFSLQFGLSSILIKRRAGLREYTDEFVRSPLVKKTMRQVKTIYDPTIASMGSEKMRSVVEIVLNNGEVISGLAEDARGTHEKPLTEKDIYEKFKECASFAINKSLIDGVYNSAKRIVEYSDINDFTELLK